jgi:prepilin-type N-terminal cleavage/methylation domain-containing protein
MMLQRRTVLPADDRAGFTLIELMVAITVFTVGLLAMASTAAALMNMLASSEARTVGSAIAESRFERIAAQTCANRTSGTATSRSIAEAWTRFPLAQADDVVVNVTFLSGHRSRTERFTSYIPC